MVQSVLAHVTYGVGVSAVLIDLSQCVLWTVALIFWLPQFFPHSFSFHCIFQFQSGHQSRPVVMCLS